MLVKYSADAVYWGYGLVKYYTLLTGRRLKKKDKIDKVYGLCHCYGICDDSEVESKVIEKVNKQLSEMNFEQFSGWKGTVANEEALKLYEEKHELFLELGYNRCANLNKLKKTPVASMKMKDILNELTGEQFIKFCEEVGANPINVIGGKLK